MNTPTRITLVRIALIPVFIVLMYVDLWILAAIVFVIAALTDMLDGHLARRNNQVTNLGKFLDPIADKLLTSTAFILLTRFGSLSAVACLLFISRDIIINGFRMVASDQGEVVAAGWMGKLKTTLQIVGIVMLLMEESISLGFLPDAVISAALVFSLWSAADYIWANRGVLQSPKGGNRA